MNVRVTQIDGKLPNLALMAISWHHRQKGDQIYFHRDVERGLFEPEYQNVYASCIFKFSNKRLSRFVNEFPEAVIGGTGTDKVHTVESLFGPTDGLDYSLYPDFSASIGFTQRGCRLSCKFCVVPAKEGKNRSELTIADIWRGEPYPKHIHLLDNDFFGQPREQWQARIEEIRSGGFKICINQGINVRLIDDEAASALATIDYRDDSFKTKRVYTAWDNLRDEGIFFSGMDRLEKAGIPAKHVMAYMLIGYDKEETWERIWHRFNRMVERGISPYPMVFDRSRTDLLSFQRWVITGIYRFVKWDEYKRSTKSAESTAAFHAVQGSEAKIDSNPLKILQSADNIS